MPRFYLPPEQCADSTLLLSGREAHHALHVLRIRTGDRVAILDGAGRELACNVTGHTRDQLELTVLEERSTPAPPARITLLQALPKGKLMESIVQKATELGVARIVPLISQRVVARPADSIHKSDKLLSVAVEAIKQCGNPWLPQVQAPLALSEFLARRESFDASLLASLQPGSSHPRELFRSFYRQRGRLPQTLAVWIGPEGDFSPEEIEDIKRTGAQPITLGPLVLRSETAALYCLSILQYELQAAP